MCVSACTQKSPKLRSTMWFSQTTPDEHPLTPPPYRWPALDTLRTITKFQLVWHHLCDVGLFRSSCLFERTLTAVCALPEYRSGRNYNAGALRRCECPPRPYSFPVCLTPRRHRQADGQLSPLYPPSPSSSSFGAAFFMLCCLPRWSETSASTVSSSLKCRKI